MSGGVFMQCLHNNVYIVLWGWYIQCFGNLTASTNRRAFSLVDWPKIAKILSQFPLKMRSSIGGDFNLTMKTN